jgi:hypothetical protein
MQRYTAAGGDGSAFFYVFRLFVKSNKICVLFIGENVISEFEMANCIFQHMFLFHARHF